MVPWKNNFGLCAKPSCWLLKIDIVTKNTLQWKVYKHWNVVDQKNVNVQKQWNVVFADWIFYWPFVSCRLLFSIVKTFFSCRQSSGIAFDMPPIVFSIGLFFLDWNFCRLPSGILLMCRHRKYCSLKASLQRQAYCTRAYYRQAYCRQAYCSRGERTNKVSSLYKFPNHFVELWKKCSHQEERASL